MTQRLSDYGERRLLQEIIPIFTTGAGDDCAIVDVGDRKVAASIDPVPTPAARVIAGDDDPYWEGWLLVVINASDLAAVGVVPSSFLCALELPSDYEVEAFRRLLSGVEDACEAEGLEYVGGNIKESDSRSGVGVALGILEEYDAIARSSVQPGDVIVSIGGGGRFWFDAMEVKRGYSVSDKAESPLYKPRSCSKEVRACLEADIDIHGAIDNSDGLFPALRQLAVASGVRIILELDRLTLSDTRDREAAILPPPRLWLGWGDWNVVVGVSEGDLREVLSTVQGIGGEAWRIGRVIEGEAQLMMERGDETAQAPRLESERFAEDSWFEQGIEGYIKRLVNVNLLGI